MIPGPGSPASVWLVEDHSGYRGQVEKLINLEEDLRCTQTFESGEDLLEFLNSHFAPETILVCVGLPGIGGIEVVRRIKGISPSTEVIVLTRHNDDELIFDAICAGASGYLTKGGSPEEILSAIRNVLHGGAVMTPRIAKRVLNMFNQLRAPRWDYQLTEREKEVLAELVGGKTKAEIAGSLHLSEHTVDTHLRNIYSKLQVHSRTAAVAKAITEKLVTEPVNLGFSA